MSADATSRLNAALEGRYRIERELGEGGMATVYLADDLKHERKVALKVLKPELAAVVGTDRFLAEIKTTANLQHPHILPLFDSGEANGFLFYVMPYVAGETLRERLDREHLLPIDDAVRIATDVAETLDYAHRQGVIHRDIKPANLLLQDGKPLISDFGIALAVGAAGGGRLTETGLSVGTPHYMSPEQATGDTAVGAASDVYSLGCVLYEMLVGEPPHEGRSAQAILGKVLSERPTPATQRRPNVPPHVEAALRKALERIPPDRFASAADFAGALQNPAFLYRPEDVQGATARRGSPWPVAAVVVALAMGYVGGRLAGGASGEQAQPVIRYGVALTDDEALATSVGGSLAISRDGARIVYAGYSDDRETTRLWIRERDELLSRPVPGTEGARHPFLSPSGDRIGFVTPDRVLRVVGLGGEDPLDLVEGGVLRSGAVWGDDGYIYFETTAQHGLERVAATGGGRPEAVFSDPLEEDALAQAYPSLLPGGRGLLFTIARNTQSDGVAVLDLETGTLQEVAEGVSAVYSTTGHIIHVEADGSMFATPFDAASLEVTGEPRLLRELGGGFLQLALSESGRLAWTSVPPNINEAVWVDRSGAESPIQPAGTVRNVRFLALSPDGRRLAISTRGHPTRDDGHVWMKDLPDGPLTRLTFDGVVNFRPEFFAGGDSVLFISDRGGIRAVWKQRADGSGEATLLFADSVNIDEALLSPDGRWLVYREGNQDGERDIYARRTDGDGVPLPLATTDFDEAAPALSPDGRWLAYAARVAGQWNVFVRPFPEGEGLWRVSRNGGVGPTWSPDGREILYQTGGVMVSVPIVSRNPLSFGAERQLFSAAPYRTEVYHRSHDIASDGSGFAMVRVKEVDVVEESLYVVENFHAELMSRFGGD